MQSGYQIRLVAGAVNETAGNDFRQIIIKPAAHSRFDQPLPGKELLIPAGAVDSARNIGSTTARWLFGYLGG